MVSHRRFFVSIDLPQSVKDYLSTLTRPDIYWIKWMRPGNYHITLNFLGDLTADRVAETKEILADVAMQFSAFPVSLAAIEPKQDMLWLLPEKNEIISELQSELKTRMRTSRLGKRERRSFTPHVLLAKSKTGRNMRPVIENFQIQDFTADSINLYESELTPGSATHRLIQSFPLQ